MTAEFTHAQLKVFSNICANLAAFWFLATITARHFLVLTLDITFAIIATVIAVIAEKLSEEL